MSDEVEDAAPGMVLGKNTKITVTIGAILALIYGVTQFVRSDTNLHRDLGDLRALSEQNSRAMAELQESIAVTSAGVARIESATGDRWTRSHQRRWAREVMRLNRGFVTPDVDEIANSVAAGAAQPSGMR